MQWIDERAVMAYELGAARFLLEHYFAGTANDHVRQETQAWLDRARGLVIARSSYPGRPDDCDQSDEGDKPGRSQGSPFDRLGE